MYPSFAAFSNVLFKTLLGSTEAGVPSGNVISQNIRAAPGASVRQGNTENEDGSGLANMSASVTRAKPSIADPSKPIPSAKAFSNSAGAIATDFKNPSTSVNHRRTNLMLRSSKVRSTNSCCLAKSDGEFIGGIKTKPRYGCVNKLIRPAQHSCLNNERVASFNSALWQQILGNHRVCCNF